MPGGGLLFLAKKKLKNGRFADFYINRKGTKIEVSTEDDNGKEFCEIYKSESFPFEKWEFTEDEIEEVKEMLKGKGTN